MNTVIKIDPLWFMQVKKHLGGPGIEQVFLNDDEVKSVCLFPAMMEYFRVFPILEDQSYNSRGNTPFEVDFPDEYVFGVVSGRHTDKGTQGYGTPFDPLIGGLRFVTGTNRGIRHGIKRRKGGVIRPGGGWYRDALNNRQMYNSLQELETFKTKVDLSKRKVYVYSSGTSRVVLTWARYSLDFDNDVKFEQKTNVVNLAGAYLLDHAADASSIINDGTQEKEFNTDAMRSRAEAIKEKIFEAWANHPRVVISRGA